MANITDIERLNYYEGEFLGALDFQAEQEYHRDMRRRHNVGQHTWGIVSGLDIAQVPVPGSTSNAVDVYIQPGMAVDAFGREIIVLNKTQLTLDLFAAYINPGLLNVWISYAEVPLNPPSDPCTAANQPNAFGRVQEAFALSFPLPDGTGPTNDPVVVDNATMAVPAQPTPPPPPVPPPVPGIIVLPYDYSVPYQEFPTDDSAAHWYVLLGQVFWDPTLPALVQISDSQAAFGRQYVGNVTSAIFTPHNSLVIRDRFAPYTLPKDLSDPTLKKSYGGVGVEIFGSLSIDRLLEARQNVLIDGNQDLTHTDLSPLTIKASSADKSFIQFRDSSVAIFSIWETPANGTTIPAAGLSFGDAGSNTPTLFIQKGGNVGIGTPNPTQNLSVNGGLSIDQANANSGSLNPGLTFGRASGGGASGEGIASNRTSAVNQFGLDFFTGSAVRVSLTQAGRVGVGTTTPRNPVGIRGASTWEELLSFEDASGNTKWHINQNPPGQTRGLNFSETGVSDFRLFLQVGGNVGIGTGSPCVTFDVASGSLHVGGNTSPVANTQQGAYLAWNALTGGTGETDFINNRGLAPVGGGGFAFFNIAPNATNLKPPLMVITGSGTVGIGTAMPTATLDVQGTFKASASVAGGETNTGWVLGRGASGPDNWLRLTTTPVGSTYHDLAVNSFWAAGSQRFDLAEITPANAEEALEQGDVVVIDRQCGMQVTRSSKAFDTSVYGVVSSYDQASMVIGGFGGPEAVKGDNSKLPIALVGRAKAKVTNENGPIEVGDLLTTSSTPGHLMRCGSSRCIGSIVGKALESFTEEFGLITIRVSLH